LDHQTKQIDKLLEGLQEEKEARKDEDKAIAAGLLSTVLIGLMGLARRGHLRSGWVLAATPLYWACQSIAAWRALWQLWSDPYRWEKTEHGLTQNRQSTEIQRAQAMHPMKRQRGFQR